MHFTLHCTLLERSSKVYALFFHVAHVPEQRRQVWRAKRNSGERRLCAGGSWNPVSCMEHGGWVGGDKACMAASFSVGGGGRGCV